MELTPEILKQAKEEIEAICIKYQITLVPVVIHQGDRTVSSIEILPLRKQESQPTQQ
jgi:hypothetical protein